MHTNAHANRYPNWDGDCNCYTECYSYLHVYSHAYCHCDSNGNATVHSHTYLDGKTDANAEDRSNAKAASHPATAPLGFVCENETHCSI